MADDLDDWAAEFIRQLDLGLLDGALSENIQRLTPEQLERVARMLIRRSSAAGGGG